MSELEFFIDYSRCIGCQACVQACEECDTHRGSLDDPPGDHPTARQRADRAAGCMHCEDPICARSALQTPSRRRPMA